MEAMTPRFSILIIGFRSLRFLPKLFASLEASGGPSREILFLDNDSPEPEAEWIRDNVRDSSVRVLESAENLFFGGGMNYLAREARGEFLLLLNPDTFVDPDWLDVLDAYLKETGFEAAQLDLREPNGPRLLGYNLDRMGMNREVRASDLPRSGRIFTGSGAAFVFRRDIYADLGGLDENFRMYFEDLDLCWRANLFGYRMGFAAGAVVHHVGGGSSRRKFFPWVLFRNIRNRGLCFVKNAGPWLLLQFLFLNFLLRLARLPVNMLTGRFGEACAEVAAVASFFWMLPSALARRARIQRRRRMRDAELLALGFITRDMKYLRFPGSAK
jgi:GT2 family glycosyltransferase